MFWGLVMEPGKRYAQTVDKSFHVSMACLEPSSSDNEYVPVMLDIENQEFILCNLHKHKTIQCQLDLNFRSGNKIAFFSSGKSRVHLTGYVIEEDDDEGDFDMSGDMSDEELEEDTSITKGKSKLLNNSNAQGKRKSDGQPGKPEAKKSKLSMSMMNQADSDEDDDDDEEYDDFAESDESEDEEMSDEESDEEEEDESDDMVATMVQKTPDSKKNKQQQQQNKTPQNKTPMEKMNNLNKTKTPNEHQDQKKKKKSLAQSPQEGTPKTPTNAKDANDTHPTPHPSKKKLKKMQQQQAESPAAESPKPGQSPGPLKKTLQGGVNVHDLKVGEGPVAKPGKRVTVYYVGRLKQNNKQFDATTQGPGFKFQLGGGEVIKGWDIGVAGMRVGGKRKIICPPHMAYGNKGSPPAIPPNSSLVFEVELKSVN